MSENLFFTGDLTGYEFVKVYTLDGKLVCSTLLDSGKVNMNHLPAGNYILNLSGTQQQAQNIPFIKK
ncbi:T9SS type A sorting domain-containing protein [Kaistella sp. 97-N-M2]|uniref:T9SS type A sorting domain-containing protein n=1 Tax=Kaistella sp. 97-N-M2 TaxID=2908645 RepID=UPI001F3D733B|nr:T9SS type A sorting domain-containing protein [Kaistella sp. 97-N-M2]UJF30017.1 T9SS type A sorting domain-containing protein [Kaistella sp. 97-N-M2]